MGRLSIRSEPVSTQSEPSVAAAIAHTKRMAVPAGPASMVPESGDDSMRDMVWVSAQLPSGGMAPARAAITAALASMLLLGGSWMVVSSIPSGGSIL